MNGFRLVSESVKRITDKTFDKKFVLLARVVNYWPDIVGQEMAKHAIPTKLNYRKSGRGKEASYKAILDIACSSAHAAKLQYRTDLIIEKLHHTIGRDVISGIRFVHLPANTSKSESRRPTKKRKTLTLEQKNTLSHVLESIEDPELMQKLESLGTSMMTDPHRK